MKSIEPDPLAAALRRERRDLRIGLGSTCDVCGSTSQLHVAPDGRTLCYADRSFALGRSQTEVDHVAGRRNLGGLVARLRANDHRDVTEVRVTLGLGTVPPAEGNPILQAAHVLGGLATLMWLIMRWLVDLSAWLDDRLGSAWWEDAPPFPIVDDDAQ